MRRIVLEGPIVSESKTSEQPTTSLAQRLGLRPSNLVETPLPGGGYMVQPEVTQPPRRDDGTPPRVDDRIINQKRVTNPEAANFDGFNEFMKEGAELARAATARANAAAGTLLVSTRNWCRGCGAMGRFTADFRHHTITCESCRRVVSDQVFEREQRS